jgi:hypothetical protein
MAEGLVPRSHSGELHIQGFVIEKGKDIADRPDERHPRLVPDHGFTESQPRKNFGDTGLNEFRSVVAARDPDNAKVTALGGFYFNDIGQFDLVYFAEFFQGHCRRPTLIQSDALGWAQDGFFLVGCFFGNPGNVDHQAAVAGRGFDVTMADVQTGQTGQEKLPQLMANAADRVGGYFLNSQFEQ